MKRLKIVLLLVLSVLFVAACSSNEDARANKEEDSNDSDFPGETVEIIVPFEAGDTMDLAAHALAQEFKEITGQDLVVNNQPGGSGVPGTMQLVNSDPDGYTISMIASGQLGIRPITQDVKYDFDDFTPIIGVGDFQMHPVAAADAPYDDVAEMVEYFADSGEKLKAGTPGVNTYSHIFLELLNQETGLDFNHLPFEGGPAVVAQILGGSVDIGVINVTNVASGVESGDLKILGFPTEERVDSFPDVPTLEEQGIDIVGGPTFGVYGPADMPEEIVDALNQAFSEAIDSDDFSDFAEKNDILLTRTEPQKMMEQIKSESESIAEIIK